jgi:hypothetical protein
MIIFIIGVLLISVGVSLFAGAIVRAADDRDEL